MRSRAVLCVLIAVVAVVSVPGFALSQSALGANQAGQTPESTATNTTIAIHPRPNGDARFRIFTTFTLDGPNETAAFRALAREFEAGTVGYPVSTFRRAANQSSIVTGRPMNITNVTRNTTIVGENSTGANTGTFVLAFTWTNFARTNGNRILVGDAFNTTRGTTWLPGLTANQALVIDIPRGYAVARSPPVIFSNGTLRWEGPTKFEPGSPSVAFERRRPIDRPPIQGDGTDGSGPLESTPLVALGAGVVVLVAGVAVLGAYALTRRDETDERTAESGQVEASEPSEIVENMSQSDTTDANTASDALAADELLSDEERVERLLARNDGRMKQASIVSETGWSNAKVSQLLSGMDEAGRINKLRIGRENLISLPSEEE